MSNDNEIYEFKAKIINERYYSEDTHWGVFSFVTDDNIPEFEVYKADMFGNSTVERKTSTLSGKMQYLMLGSEYNVVAKLEYNSKYKSWQYVPKTVTSLVPKTQEEQATLIQCFVRPDVAEQLINKYPNLVNDIISGKVKDVDYSKIKGLGQKTWEKLRDTIIDNYVVSDIITLLQPIGVTYNVIKKLLQDEPNPSLLKQKLENNPYELLKVHGLGWQKVDNMALKLKPELRNDIKRLVAFTRYDLTEIGNNNGHSHTSISNFKKDIATHVPECMSKLEELLTLNNFVYVYKSKGDNRDKDRIGLTYMYSIEESVFNILAEKSHFTHDKFKFSEEEINLGIEQAEKEQGFEYTDEQRQLIMNAVQSNTLFIYTGSAGTGKSSVAKAIFKILRNRNLTISPMALSAKASQRISEATGYNASTIHRALSSDGQGGFNYCYENPLPTDVIFLDEASMVSADLFYALVSAINYDTKLIICGDDRQLPPIGFGNIFADLLTRSDVFNTFRLTKVLRQSEDSGILSDANKIRKGINPLQCPEPKIVHGVAHDMCYLFKTNRDAMQERAIEIYLKSIEQDGLDEVIIVTPRKKNCINSADEINNKIQDILIDKKMLSISYGDKTFRLGAKVRQTVNNYQRSSSTGIGVFNGEVGYVTNIVKIEEKGKKKTFCDVTFKNLDGTDKILTYAENEIGELDLAYAMTCHSCQGSGYKTVVGLVDNTHFALLDNCMLYTLLTRAKKRAVLLAEPQSYNTCITTDHMKRNTWFPIFKYDEKFHYRDVLYKEETDIIDNGEELYNDEELPFL